MGLVQSARPRLKQLLRDRLGVEVRRRQPARPPTTAGRGGTGLPAPVSADRAFLERYETGRERSDTPHHSSRPVRYYNLVQSVQATSGIPGVVVECGCWRGLSSYLICHELALERPGYTGEGYHVFDSFEGLSPGDPEDLAPEGHVFTEDGFGDPPGTFAASVDHVRGTLAEFPDVGLHKGWIPDCFADAPTGPVRFVHLDLDLYQPTLDALRRFHTDLAPGGIIVCDDYGTAKFPGVRQAVEEHCDATGAPLLRLSTGQALMFPATCPRQ